MQNPRRNKCSAVVEKKCLVAEYRTPYSIPSAFNNYTIIIVGNCTCATLIDGLGHATRSRPGTYLSQASCMIVSGFRTALDLDTYPHSNLIRPRCAEWAKPGRGKPALIMHNYCLFRLFSRHRSRFSKITTLFFMPL